MRVFAGLGVVGALAFGGVQAQAALLLADDFELDAATFGTVENFNGFTNWTVDQGTVDLLQVPNIYNLPCAAGSSGCVDSDGTTNDAGRMVSRDAFTFAAGSSYTLQVDFAGNMRRNTTDTELVQFVSADASSVVKGFSIASIGPNQPWTTATFNWSPGADTTGRVALVGLGGDNQGLLLDNFTLCSNNSCAVAVPEADSLALMVLGLLSLGRLRARLGRWQRG